MNTRTQVGCADLSRPVRRSVPAQNLGIECSCRMAALAERQRALHASTTLIGFAGKPRGFATLIESGCDRNKVRPVVE